MYDIVISQDDSEGDMANLVTKESLIHLLNGPHKVHVIGRALAQLLDRQTLSEQTTLTTRLDNGVGFTGGDAYSGTLTAKYYNAHKTLQDWQVEKWMKPNKHGEPRLVKYWKQLDECAQQRAKEKV